MDVSDATNDSAVGIDFNRPFLRGVVTLTSVSSLILTVLMPVVSWSLLWDKHTGFVRWIELIELPALVPLIWFNIRYTLHLAYCLRYGTPAFIFCREGVVDNWIFYCPILVPWSQLTRIYPTTYGYLNLPFMRKQPAWVPRHRAVMFLMKSQRSHYTRTRLKAMMFYWSLLGRKWFMLDERVVDVTAVDFMHCLGGYYIKHVREAEAA